MAGLQVVFSAQRFDLWWKKNQEGFKWDIVWFLSRGLNKLIQMLQAALEVLQLAANTICPYK